ncbi:MAG: hypothetical protein K9L30_01680 [Desulfobacterales bacterium]|nr:hypothetical protein [Desulfobacterales bacterium]
MNEKKRKNFQKIIWLPALLVIVGIIFFLWPGNAEEEADVFVPILYEGLPRGLMLTGTPLKGLDIRVRGSESAIAAISGQKISYNIDLSGEKAGVNTVSVEIDRMIVPSGITIISLNQNQVTVVIERQIEKQVPVLVHLVGQPAAGHKTVNAITDPGIVLLRGAEKLLNPLEQIMTKPVDISNLSGSVKKEVTLNIPEGLEIISSSVSVQAVITIDEDVINKKYDAIPVNGKGGEGNFNISPQQVNIEVRGPVNILEKLDIENRIDVYVDLTDLDPGVYVRRAVISLPVGTILISADPEIFTVKIHK